MVATEIHPIIEPRSGDVFELVDDRIRALETLGN